MPKKKNKFSRRIPPCPGNPEDYILYKGKYGYHWQRKRGTVKEATLNKVLTLSSHITGPTNDAARRVMTMLAPFTQRMDLGRTSALIAGAFKKSYLRSGRMDFSFLEKLDFHEDHPFHKLCKGGIMKWIEKDTLYVKVEAGDGNMIMPSKMADTYEFHAILLFGDPSTDNGLRVDVERSEMFRFDADKVIDFQFNFVLPPPRQPWMVLLHIGCRLNLPTRPSPIYYRMKVIKAGGGGIPESGQN
jgi:hypothetical protein